MMPDGNGQLTAGGRVWDYDGADDLAEAREILGGTMLGIDAFAEELGVEPIPSIHTEHLWHWYAPELADWSDPPTELDSPASSVPVGSVPG